MKHVSVTDAVSSISHVGFRSNLGALLSIQHKLLAAEIQTCYRVPRFNTAGEQVNKLQRPSLARLQAVSQAISQRLVTRQAPRLRHAPNQLRFSGMHTAHVTSVPLSWTLESFLAIHIDAQIETFGCYRLCLDIGHDPSPPHQLRFTMPSLFLTCCLSARPPSLNPIPAQSPALTACPKT